MTDQDDVARDLVQRAHAEDVRPTFDIEAGVSDVLARAEVEVLQLSAPRPVISQAVASGAHPSALARRPEMPVSGHLATCRAPMTVDDRLSRIESVTDAALAHLDVEDLLVELLDQVRELLEVDTATVLLVDSSSQQLVATAAEDSKRRSVRGFASPWGRVSSVASQQKSTR